MIICKYIIDILIKEKIISHNDRDVYEYGLFVILYNSFLLFDILLIGFFTNNNIFSILFLLFWTPYRIFIGGSHCSSTFKCWIFFNIYYLLASYLYYILNIYLLLFLNMLCLYFEIKKIQVNLSFILIWILFFIFTTVLPKNTVIIINITYLLNSILTLHECYSKKEYII